MSMECIGFIGLGLIGGISGQGNPEIPPGNPPDGILAHKGYTG